MDKPWDNGAKRLLDEAAQDFLDWVLQGAFAQEQVPLIEQVEVLEDLFFKVAVATTVEDARTALVAKQ
jgi:hypothetical protein